MARAAWNDLRGRPLQGGSTITQQLVKNYYLTQQRTLSRKVREAVVAVKIERTLGKDQILEDYLNTIYYGRSAYGIQAASRAYFGVPVQQPDPRRRARCWRPSSAALAATPRRRTSTGLKDRWTYVLDGMVKEGWITPGAAAGGHLPDHRAEAAGGQPGRHAGLPHRGDPQGARDPRLLRGARRQRRPARRDDLRRARPSRRPMAAVKAQRPDRDRRARRARHGGPGDRRGRSRCTAAATTSRQQYDDATQSAPQAGSTFKPFALAAALENGVGLSSKWDGHSPQTVQGPSGPYVVKNYGGESLRPDVVAARPPRTPSTPCTSR